MVMSLANVVRIAKPWYLGLILGLWFLGFGLAMFVNGGGSRIQDPAALLIVAATMSAVGFLVAAPLVSRSAAAAFFRDSEDREEMIPVASIVAVACFALAVAMIYTFVSP